MNKHTYKHLQTPGKKLKSIDEWLGARGKALNRQQLNNFHAIHTLLKEQAQDMYSKGEGLFHCKQYGHKLAGMEILTFHDEEFGDREIIIKWVKIPTFPKENKIQKPHSPIRNPKGRNTARCLGKLTRNKE